MLVREEPRRCTRILASLSEGSASGWRRVFLGEAFHYLGLKCKKPSWRSQVSSHHKSGRYNGSNEISEEEQRMVRQWWKMLLLALLVLLQMACPRYATKQNDDARFHRFDQLREHG